MRACGSCGSGTTTKAAEVRIRSVHAGEGERLREIAIAAKSHWGYEPARVREWAGGGDFSPGALSGKEVFVADAEGLAIGWAALTLRGDVAWLDDLWVEPAWIGEGVGSLLFGRVVARARELGAERIEWESEPNAVGFYERLGARRVGEGQLSSWGRVIPVMGLDLGEVPQGSSPS